MKPIKLCIFSISLAVLAGCSSSDDDSGSSGNTPSATDELQGTWASECFTGTDQDATQDLFIVSGNSFTRAEVIFVNSTSCDSDQSISINANGTFVIPGEVEALADGDANHVDATFINGTITGSQALLDTLEASGTTLQDVVSANLGITEDITNLPLSVIGESQAALFTIYRINNGNEVQLGNNDGVFDGSSPDLRPTELSDFIFTKVE